MHQSSNENRLIVVDIVDVMQEYASIQPDIDPTKMKSSELVAQTLDISRNINPDNLQRCIDPQNEVDEQLREMVIPALCYFTYSRALKMWQGVLTDGGYSTEGEADSRDAAKSVANEHYAIGESMIAPVIEWLEAENPQEQVQIKSATPSVRVFGGEERRASN